MSDDKTYTKLKTELKRGTGTRDQDKTVVTTRNPDPTTAVENHREAVRTLTQFAAHARSVDPDADPLEDTDDEGDGDGDHLVDASTDTDDGQPLTRPDDPPEDLRDAAAADDDVDTELGAFDPSDGGGDE